jgi:uncharacterized linocin/CFP29 family protein
MDFVLNGQAQGSVANKLMAHNWDPGALRPFVGSRGQSLLTVNTGQYDSNGQAKTQTLVTNAPATLRKDDWLAIDRAVVKVAQPRLKLVGRLRAAGLQYTIPNGMGKTVLESETMSDITDANVSMDGLTQGAADRPEFDLVNLPLPIIHKDFHFSARQVMASRNGGSPIDTSNAELAARKVAEMAEKMALGTASTYRYGGGYVYGLLNFPSRITGTIATPTTTNQQTILNDILIMKKRLQQDGHFGPYDCYFGLDWDPFLDGDYNANYGGKTLRQRITEIQGIESAETMDYLTGYNVLLVQRTSDVIRMVVGMEIVTVQWETQGGMQLNFKVMAIMVPQVRADHNGQCGVCHYVP